jgi:catechol 2,3-dioxygenase-like lactoylglutathione lyase family enzyme
MPAGAEESARAFYAGVLGMQEVAKPEHLRTRGGCWFRISASMQLHLGVEEPFRPATKAHPALEVTDLQAARAAIAAGGHTVIEDTQLEGYDRFYTADPFGNRVEILARAVSFRRR